MQNKEIEEEHHIYYLRLMLRRKTLHSVYVDILVGAVQFQIGQDLTPD